MEVENLTVDFGPPRQPIRAVAGASLVLHQREIVGLVGESGSGKSTLCAALLRAEAPGARVSGRVRFGGLALRDLPEAALRALRGREIAMVLQNPMTSLDPLYTIGSQVGEVLRTHRPDRSGPAAVLDLLRRVRITAPELRAGQYPHQMSGGMKQRVLTGMATACAPKLLVADEPTTALDVTIQEEILALFRHICDGAGTAILLVTHDLRVVRRVCDRVVVMYAGRIVESGGVEEVFGDPRHPYTRALIRSLPRVEGDAVRLEPVAGQVPLLDRIGPGCAFAPRCPVAVGTCAETIPAERQVAPGRRVACGLAEPVA
jgi:peptide/nickel transport system ATP-binding protein/oligopeptide transport system ATP-binding protein